MVASPALCFISWVPSARLLLVKAQRLTWWTIGEWGEMKISGPSVVSLFIFVKFPSLLFHLQDMQRFLDKSPVNNLRVFMPFVCANPHLFQCQQNEIPSNLCTDDGLPFWKCSTRQEYHHQSMWCISALRVQRFESSCPPRPISWFHASIYQGSSCTVSSLLRERYWDIRISADPGLFEQWRPGLFGEHRGIQGRWVRGRKGSREHGIVLVRPVGGY